MSGMLFYWGGADVCKQMSYFLLRKIVIESEEFLPVWLWGTMES